MINSQLGQPSKPFEGKNSTEHKCGKCQSLVYRSVRLQNCPGGALRCSTEITKSARRPHSVYGLHYHQMANDVYTKSLRTASSITRSAVRSFAGPQSSWMPNPDICGLLLSRTIIKTCHWLPGLRYKAPVQQSKASVYSSNKERQTN